MTNRAPFRLAATTLTLAALLSAGAVQPVLAQTLDPLAPLAEVTAPSQDTPDPPAPTDEPEKSSSIQVARITKWVAATGDNGSRPFIVIDKVGAEVFLYDAAGQFMGKAPALIGSASGDDSSPGVGDRELTEIKPGERTTPAGRFVANFGIARGNERVLWVDYPSAISLHPVVTGNRKEQRLKRLDSTTPEDNRITYGCINVPVKFYANAVQPLLKDSGAVVYILPDTKPMDEVFASLPG
jgi:hypothetical protein